MSNIKRAVTLSVVATILGAASAYAQDCKAKHEFEVVKAGVLTVALTNTPPYSVEKDGVSGIDGDILQQFAKENCLKVEYEVYSYPAAVSAVQTNRADVAIGGFYRTAKRAKVLSLSNAVYLDQVAIESKEGYETVDSLIGKRVGTVEGYSWVGEMEKVYEGSKTYPNSLNLAQDVQAGRIDAGIDGFGAAADLTKGTDVKVKLLQPDPRITASTLATQTTFLMPPDNKTLTAAMNASLDEYRSNGIIAKALTSYGLLESAAKVGENKEY